MTQASLSHVFLLFYHSQVWGWQKWLNESESARTHALARTGIGTNNLDKRIGRQDIRFFLVIFSLFFCFHSLGGIVINGIDTQLQKSKTVNEWWWWWWRKQKKRKRPNECLLENSIYLWQNDNYEWHFYFRFGNYHTYIRWKFTQPLSSYKWSTANNAGRNYTHT